MPRSTARQSDTQIGRPIIPMVNNSQSFQNEIRMLRDDLMNRAARGERLNYNEIEFLESINHEREQRSDRPASDEPVNMGHRLVEELDRQRDEILDDSSRPMFVPNLHLQNYYFGNNIFEDDEIRKVRKKDIRNNNKFNLKGKKCSECNSEKDLSIATGKVLCKECSYEFISVCEVCKTVENESIDFVTVIFEGKFVDVCFKCIKEFKRCAFNNCLEILKDNGIVCDTCQEIYCKFHVKEHECGGHTPYGILRHVSNKHIVGDISKANKIRFPRLVGIELECVNGDPEKVSKLNRIIGIQHDGSLKGKNPIEIQTPPANADKLEILLSDAIKVLRNAGYEVNKSCGVHIHFDSKDFINDYKKLYRLIIVYYAVEPLIYAMLPKSRKDNKYALPLKNWINEATLLNLGKTATRIQDIEEMWYKTRGRDDLINHYKQKKYDSSRYHGFNIHALFSQRHIEMRYHHGTLNATKLINWINLHLLLFDWALNKYDETIVNALMFAASPLEKLRIMNRHMNLDKITRRYILKNLKKFNVVS